MAHTHNNQHPIISSDERKQLRQTPILIVGGGSTIAECALRLGFHNFTLANTQCVEPSDLETENFTQEDLYQNKAKAIQKRLLSIQPDAQIQTFQENLNQENIHSIVENQKIAVNCLENAPQQSSILDQACQYRKIPVIHPYNLGFGALVTILSANGRTFDSIQKDHPQKIVQYAQSYLKFWRIPQEWLDPIVAQQQHNPQLPTPQTAVASCLLASMCTHLMYLLATDQKTKTFPEFYLSHIENS